MPLKLYKRSHSPACLRALRQKGIRAADALENYRHCRCAWWVSGSTDHGRVIARQSLKVYTWDAASAALKKLNQSEEARPVTLTRARDQWATELGLGGRARVTVARYLWAVSKLVSLAGESTALAAVTPVLINRLRAEWVAKGVALATHRNELSWISMFFKYAVRMGYIRENPVSKVDPVRKRRRPDDDGEEEPTATLPLDLEGDRNYRQLVAAIPPYLETHVRGREGVFYRRPGHLVALAELMYETGLRVSDAVFFAVAKMRVDRSGGSYTIRQIKTGHPVTVFLEPWLAAKLQALPEISPGYIFFDGREDWKGFIRAAVYRVLRGCGEAAGIPGVRPHRFRDSFAVNCLNQGLLMEELQKLLGHKSLDTTEKYYAPFVPSREAHLRARVLASKAALAPGVIPIDRRQSA